MHIVDIGPNVSAAQQDFFESDVSILERQKKEKRRNYTRGNPILISAKILSCSSPHLCRLSNSQDQGDNLVYCCIVGDATGAIHFIDLIARKNVKSVRNHKGPVSAIALFPKLNPQYILTGSWDKSLHVYRLDSQLERLFCLQNVHDDFIKVISPINQTEFLTGSFDKSIQTWEFIGNTPIAKSSFLLHKRSLEDCLIIERNIFSTDPNPREGPFALTASSDTLIHCTCLRTGDVITSLQGHDTSVYALQYCEYSDLLLSGSADKRLIQWDLEDKCKIEQEWHIGDWVKSLAYSHKFHVIFVGTREGFLIVIDTLVSHPI